MTEYNLYLDIETIPTQSTIAWGDALAAVTAPGSYKKQESIDEWLAENRERVAREAIAKTSFDPAQGHICTISWAAGDDDITTAHAETVDQEADVLRAFFGAMGDFDRPTFVGHYVGGFDLRFIICRAVVLGVPIPRGIPRDPKPWESRVFDTMQAWAGAKGTISMKNLAAALGIPAKDDGFDGSQVAEAWANGEHQRVADYCAADVEAVRAIHKKFTAVNW